jgi:hypothetical protein
MSQTGIEIGKTIDAWAEITLKAWQQKLDALGFGHEDFHLYDSLALNNIEKSMAGKQFKMKFGFNHYGKFIDMGVNRWGDINQRQWYYSTFYHQTERLKEIMAEKFRTISVERIHQAVDEMFTAQKRSVITARNYNKRRAKHGRWVNNSKTWKPYNYKQLQAMGY